LLPGLATRTTTLTFPGAVCVADAFAWAGGEIVPLCEPDEIVADGAALPAVPAAAA
jgi:hypothetical protein